MKFLLLSGGSGKRLWPLSNDTRSKQFLKVLDGAGGIKQSMVQRVWSQLQEENMADSAFVATSNLQKDMIRMQIGENVPIVTEPERRDTFPAIALAASYMYSVAGLDKEEIVAVLPVDPYVERAFFAQVKKLEAVLRQSKADLALIGVKPTYPSSKYGYIVPEAQKAGKAYYKVSRFTEKPDEQAAEKLIGQNAFWNCGVFAFKLGYVLDMLKEKQWPADYEALLSMYQTLPKISFDYEVVEKAKHIAVLPYEGYWKDLGTWNTLTEEMAAPQIGKGVVCAESVNTHLVNELDIPVTVMGTTDLIIAASPDGILVADKNASPNIKELIKEFDYPPMYEERLWGWVRTLDGTSYPDGEEMAIKRICILAGKNSTYHYHNLRDEVWTIIRGEGELALDDSLFRIKAGDVVHLPAGKKHGIRAIKELEFVEVQTGAGISNEDVFRLYYNWDDVIQSLNKSKPKIFT